MHAHARAIDPAGHRVSDSFKTCGRVVTLLISLRAKGVGAGLITTADVQQFIKEGAKNLVENDSLHQYHCYFWDEDRMSIGLMNHGFLNFINPTVWDMN